MRPSWRSEPVRSDFVQDLATLVRHHQSTGDYYLADYWTWETFHDDSWEEVYEHWRATTWRVLETRLALGNPYRRNQLLLWYLERPGVVQELLRSGAYN